MSELNVADALSGLEETTRLRIIKKSVVNFEVLESEQSPQVPLWLEGILLAVHPRALLVKPEGQRQWKWWDLWCSEKLELDWELQDVSGVRFRIMSRSNWSQADYWHYELQEGPVP